MNEEQLEEYIYKLVYKSKEAYLMSIEIMNKPTIDYRTEGFLFFICNAWELLFKARIIMENKSCDAIKYKDKENRTYSIDKCISILHNREDDKIRQNLRFLLQLRNTATHLIVPEYDYDLNYAYQTCVINFYNYINKFFASFELLKSMPAFISIISTNSGNGNSFLNINSDSKIILENFVEGCDGENVVNYRLGITKKTKEADILVGITKDTTKAITIVEKSVHPNKLYPLSRNEILTQLKIRLNTLSDEFHFSTHTFDKVSKLKNIKNNPKYCIQINNGNVIMYCYSKELIDFLYDLMVDKNSPSTLHNELLPNHKKN